MTLEEDFIERLLVNEERETRYFLSLVSESRLEQILFQ